MNEWSEFSADKIAVLKIKINYYEKAQKNRSKKSYNLILEWRQWLWLDTNMPNIRRAHLIIQPSFQRDWMTMKQ